MKIKKKLVLITLLLISFQTMFAQNMEISNGLVPTLKQERTNERNESDANLVTAGYAYSATTQSILSSSGPCAFDFLAFWSTSDYLSSMCQGGDGKYYVTGTNSPSLYQLDTINVSFVLLGNITGMGADKPNGISYNPVDGNYYIVSSSNLFSFNVNTRAATLIGPFNTGGIMIDLCFDMNGICYAYDIATDAGYTINISTGNANQLGPLGFDANFGQGMSYDFDTQTIYLTAFNNGTFTGQCRIMDQVTGNTTLIYDWGLEQIDAFALKTLLSPPCPVGAPSNPNPPNGATGLPLTGNTATWTNGAGTTNVELWFGPQGNMVKVYDGVAITSFVLPTLNYNTLYRWYVVCKDTTCGTQGPIWSFTTEPEPFPMYWCDEFDNLSNWTVVGPLGTTNWSISSTANAGGTPPELEFSWTPSFNGESKIRSDLFNLANNRCYSFTFNLYFAWYADPSGIVTIGITYDGGITDTILYTLDNPTQNVGPIFVSRYFKTPSSGSQNCQIEITYSGNSFNTDNIYWDNICLEYLFSSCDPPIAPSNLTAQVIINPSIQVRLNWEDNSQDGYGFKIYRKLGYPTDPGQFNVIDTVYSNITQYLDEGVIEDSTYSYYVASFNQYGQSNSDTVSIIASVPVGVEIIGEELPKEFALMQNYPNPFNPSTKIKYTIPTPPVSSPLVKGRTKEGFVTLKVYDILGNEVATLANEEQVPGVYEVEFNSESIIKNPSSGIYFYQLRIGNFVDTKKMVLMK